jgi:hypothetical protein
MYRPTFYWPLVGGEWSASSPGRFTSEESAPRTHLIGGWWAAEPVWTTWLKYVWQGYKINIMTGKTWLSFMLVYTQRQAVHNLRCHEASTASRKTSFQFIVYSSIICHLRQISLRWSNDEECDGSLHVWQVSYMRNSYKLVVRKLLGFKVSSGWFGLNSSGLGTSISGGLFEHGSETLGWIKLRNLFRWQTALSSCISSL